MLPWARDTTRRSARRSAHGRGVTEPSTVLSDGALGLGAALLGLRLLFLVSSARAERDPARWWPAVFLLNALGALLGAVWHGWHEALGPARAADLWSAVLLVLGASNFFLVVASARVWRRPLLALAAAQLALYALWMGSHEDYRWVLADSALSLAVALAQHLYAWACERRAGAGWIVAGLLTAVAGAALQSAGVSLHERFNRQDLYHTVELCALALIYRGARAS